MTRFCIAMVLLVLSPALLFLAGCGGGSSDAVPDIIGYAYPESDGNLRLEFARPPNWSAIAGFEIYRNTRYEASSRGTVSRDRAEMPLAVIDRDDVVIWGDHVILWDTAASSGCVYAYRITIVYINGSRHDIPVLNGQAPEMNLEAVGPCVPPPVIRVTAPPINDFGYATLYWYLPGESIIQPPVATYALPGYVSGFIVQMLDTSTGSWTTVASGIGKNARSFRVPIPQPDTTYRYTVRAVSFPSGVMYPLEALSETQRDQVAVDIIADSHY